MILGKFWKCLRRQPNRGFVMRFYKFEVNYKQGRWASGIYAILIFLVIPAYMLGLATRSGNMAEVLMQPVNLSAIWR